MVFPQIPGRLALLACFVVGVAAAFALSGGKSSRPAKAGKPAAVPALDKAQAAAVTRRMDADASLATLLATCPADAWRRGGLARSAAVTAATCGRAPDDCLADCLEFARGNACLSLAFVLQKTPGYDGLYSEKLFQLACASGDASGCVNRGAGIRNGGYGDDPFATRPAAERQACEFRSFAIGCDTGDAWGCAMRGQATANGEGTPADAAAARRDFAKACAIDPQFSACRFARARRAEMEAREKGAAKDR